MKVLPTAEQARLRIVMLSFDPARDSVDVLRKTADAHGCGVIVRHRAVAVVTPVVPVVAAVFAAQSDFSHVLNGRFKGGYITRRYGRPGDGVHAVQLEQCWSSYMAEQAPYELDPVRVARVQPLLRQLLQTLLGWKPDA